LQKFRNTRPHESLLNRYKNYFVIIIIMIM